MISEIKSMWLMVMFDLPTVTKSEKREYQHFRNYLLGEGFCQMQYSVYARFCASRVHTEKYQRTIRQIVPPDGYVRLLMITDKQFGEMISLYGKAPQEIEKGPDQLLLF